MRGAAAVRSGRTLGRPVRMPAPLAMPTPANLPADSAAVFGIRAPADVAAGSRRAGAAAAGPRGAGADSRRRASPASRLGAVSAGRRGAATGSRPTLPTMPGAAAAGRRGPGAVCRPAVPPGTGAASAGRRGARGAAERAGGDSPGRAVRGFSAGGPPRRASRGRGRPRGRGVLDEQVRIRTPRLRRPSRRESVPRQAGGEVDGDAVLQREDLVPLAVGSDRVDHDGRRQVDDPGVDAEPLPDLLVAAGDRPARAEPAVQLPEVAERITAGRPAATAGSAAGSEPVAGAADHVQAARFQLRRERLGDAVAQPGVVRVGREVGEREHGDRTCLRGRWPPGCVPCSNRVAAGRPA